MSKPEETNIGSVTWSITDGDSSNVISDGDKGLHRDDVKITRKNSLLIKRISLSKHFGFSLNDDADQFDDGHGFGLSGDRDDEQTMSWDWFEVDRIGHAKKLQESGELSFNTKRTANGSEINRLEFLTDVSLRIIRRTDDPYSKPRWRIRILKGSVILWPSP